MKTPRGYSLPGAADPAADAERRLERLERVLADSLLSVRVAGTLVVLKTPPAGAHPVARALDEAGLPEAAGTIAGDDTVFVAAVDAAAARALATRLSPPATAPDAPTPRLRPDADPGDGSVRVIRVSVVGAAGYSGAEAVRLLARHPGVALAGLFGSPGGKGAAFADLHPDLAGLSGPDVVPFSEEALLDGASPTRRSSRRRTRSRPSWRRSSSPRGSA